MTDKTTKWLTIIGIGEEGYDSLSDESKSKIEAAQIIIGGRRHLKMLPQSLRAEKLSWLSPFSDNIDNIKKKAGTKMIILASGDPMDFGIGAVLCKYFQNYEMEIIPAIGSFSLALARLGWARQDTNCLSLHGRETAIINPYLQPKNQLLLLAHDGNSPLLLAQYLTASGFGKTVLHVLSHLGGAKESRQDFIAENFADEKIKQGFPDLCVIATILPAAIDAQSYPAWYPASSGLPDDAYQHHGKITKSEIRAVTLAKLKPVKDALLWDIGAGAGSIAIEWTRFGGQAIAIEKDAAQTAHIAHNAARFGDGRVEIIQGDIIDYIESLPPPDAIFIGGGLSLDLAKKAFLKLANGGRLVINAVTMESQMILFELAAGGGNLTKISVARLDEIGEFHGFKHLMEVVQFVSEKN